MQSKNKSRVRRLKEERFVLLDLYNLCGATSIMFYFHQVLGEENKDVKEVKEEGSKTKLSLAKLFAETFFISIVRCSRETQCSCLSSTICTILLSLRPTLSSAEAIRFVQETRMMILWTDLFQDSANSITNKLNKDPILHSKNCHRRNGEQLGEQSRRRRKMARKRRIRMKSFGTFSNSLSGCFQFPAHTSMSELGVG